MYHEAEEKEWAHWLKNKSVRIVKGQEVTDIYRDTDRDRFINLRFVYCDKNASVRTPQVWLPVKAKARICAQGFSEPLARAGLVKLDSPTVQRVGSTGTTLGGKETSAVHSFKELREILQKESSICDHQETDPSRELVGVTYLKC